MATNATVAIAAPSPPALSGGTVDALAFYAGETQVFFQEVASGGPETFASAALGYTILSSLPFGTYSAWLLDPVTLLVSDRIEFRVLENATASIVKYFSVALISEPDVTPVPCPSVSHCVVENGTFQDVTDVIFPVNLQIFYNLDVTVFAFSAIDPTTDTGVIEPMSLSLLGTGLAGLIIARRPRRSRHLAAA